VIAGRLAGIGTVLRGLGVSAAEAGLATGEAFDLRQQLRPRRPSEGRRPIGSGPRIYVGQLGQSLAGREWSRLMRAEGLWGHLHCKMPCCRFQAIDSSLDRAAQHSLWSRTSEASQLATMAAPIRAQRALDMLAGQRAFLATCNRALHQLGETPLSPNLLEHQVTTLNALLAGGPRAA
jgi:hypothetical protein